MKAQMTGVVGIGAITQVGEINSVIATWHGGGASAILRKSRRLCIFVLPTRLHAFIWKQMRCRGAGESRLENDASYIRGVAVRKAGMRRTRCNNSWGGGGVAL